MRPTCFECGCEAEQSGRMTWYCPDCDTCPDCGCPRVDGFEHYQGCSAIPDDDGAEV